MKNYHITQIAKQLLNSYRDGDELKLAKEAGWSIITLGKRILRTETAGMMLMSVIMYNTEE